MAERRLYFTVAEANGMIPRLKRELGRMLQIHAQVRECYARLDEAGFAPHSDEFDLSPRGAGSSVRSDLATFSVLISELERGLGELDASGVVLKALDAGLVDWYARKGDRDVFLCWKLGEDEVRYWHEIDAGFAGRRPIEEL